MGTLIQMQKTIPLPAGAKVGRDRTVMWIAKGKKRTGKLSGTGKVNVKVDTWTAQKWRFFRGQSESRQTDTTLTYDLSSPNGRIGTSSILGEGVFGECPLGQSFGQSGS